MLKRVVIKSKELEAMADFYRHLGVAPEYKAKLLRINPKEYIIRAPHIGIAKGALKALTEIDGYL